MSKLLLAALPAALASPLTNVTAQSPIANSAETQQTSLSEYYCDSQPFKAMTYRERLTDSGITFQNNLTQFYFGNNAGGREREYRYGGHGDYVMNLDMGKLGVQEGLFVKFRAEHRIGESISEATGSLIPATIAANLPVNDTRDLYLTNLLITQAFSENFVVFAGKLDTLDGDANAFASGRGISQFSNLAFVANPITLRTIPYATLGAGFAFLMDGEQIFNFTVLNATDTTRTDGFSELFADGAAIAAELRLPTMLFGKPGHQLFGATWSSRNFTSFGQDPRVILPSISLATSSGSWSLYWNTDQYLFTDACEPGRGWGYFARAGIADDSNNPFAYFLSAGLGGSSPFRNRKADTFGVGYYYSGSSTEFGPVAQTVLGSIGDGQGMELFYNMAITPNLYVTPDLQVTKPAVESLDAAVIAGIRVNLAF